jgi:hypothetical protein
MKHRISATYKNETFEFVLYDCTQWLTLLHKVAGITLTENVVFVKYQLKTLQYLIPTLVGHEAIHIYQARKLGWKFLPVYLWKWARAGFRYRENPMEIEAYTYQSTVQWNLVTVV